MKKIRIIIWREFISRVKTRTFLFTTLLAPIGIILLLSVQILVMLFSSQELKIGVKDESKNIIKSDTFLNIQEELAEKDVDLQVIFEDKADFDGRLKRDLDGIVHITKDIAIATSEKKIELEFVSDKYLSLTKKSTIERALSEVFQNELLKNAGISLASLEEIEKTRVTLSEQSATSEDKKGSSEIAHALGFGMGFLMYMTIMIYGTMVMKGVSEEKTNRIIEVILSSVKPFQLMVGKILGIGMVGLFQFLMWIILSSGIYMIAGLLMASFMDPGALATGADMTAIQNSGVDVNGILQEIQEFPLFTMSLCFLFYFFGGYLLYAALFAAVGSLIGEENDSQSIVFPITVPIIISFFILFAVFENPDGALAVWASIIPFSSSINMPARIAFGGVPIWQILISMVSLIGGFFFTTWLASRIYRVAILMIGKQITFKEVIYWIRKSN